MKAPLTLAARIVALPASAASAEVAALIADVRADLAAAEEAHAKLQGDRRAILLAGDDAAAEEHDRRTAAESRRAERARLHLEELEKRQAAAEKREDTARLDEQRRQAEKVAAELCEALSTEYEPHARAIAEFLTRWRDGHRLIGEVNAALRHARRHDSVQPPEVRKRYTPPRQEPDRLEERQEWRVGKHPCTIFGTNLAGQLVPTQAGAELVTVRETIPGAVIPQQSLPSLHSAVVLPAAEIGASPFWPKA